MLFIALALVVIGALSLRAGNRELESHASSDALTGLGNRRKLLADLERRVKASEPAALTLFEDIALGARVVSVCDAFDAVISERPMRGRTVEEALAEPRRCAGTQFDPAVVAAFERVLAERAKSPTAT